MNNLFDKVKSNVNKGVSVVNLKSKTMIEIAKINTQINTIETKKKTYLDALAKTVYTMYCNNNVSNEEINSRCSEISEINANIEELREQINQLQEEEQETLNKLKPRTCTCGELIKEGSIFCSKCGAKVDSSTFCECGATIREGAKFCGGCGKTLESDEKPSE